MLRVPPGSAWISPDPESDLQSHVATMGTIMCPSFCVRVVHRSLIEKRNALHSADRRTHDRIDASRAGTIDSTTRAPSRAAHSIPETSIPCRTR
jgi:hypothetical protein